jgi:L-erythro-3,5-diaminohexanoate dehydrogenase
MQKKGNKYGTHRVIEPKGVLPQPANKIDNNMDEIYDNEILIDVQTLNIDSASFTDILNYAKQQAGEGASQEKVLEEVKKEMLLNVELQGKHRNRRTGSGGMLLGRVEKIGDALKGKIDLKEGDKIATLVSLSLTPLRIDEFLEIRPDVDQVDIKGKAILFESGIYAKIPSDMPEKLALSALDVAGAPAQTAKLCKPGDTVLIIGAGGKSGMLCCYEAKKRVGVTGKVIGMCHSERSTKRLQDLGFCDVVFAGNATDPVAMMEKISELTDGKMADITINNVNITDTEMTSVLCTKNDGTVYFFSMSTSFTKAALGAEGVGSDVTMIIGNGYTKGHAEITLQELRECPKLRKVFEELYA